MMTVPVSAAESSSSHISTEDLTVTVITGESNIKEYLESNGEAYDPSLVAVYQIEEDNAKESTGNDYAVSPAYLGGDYVVVNAVTDEYTDLGNVLRSYTRPAGTVKITETVTISDTIKCDVKAAIKVIETTVSITNGKSHSFQIEWSNTYSYSVNIKIFPRYQRTRGSIIEDDVWYDDEVCDFTALKAIGDEIRVYRIDNL